MPEPKGGQQKEITDPSTLTTQQILREIAQLRELFDTRMEANDKAILLLQTFADKSPTTASVEQQVLALKELHETKLKSIEGKFTDTTTIKADCEHRIAEMQQKQVDNLAILRSGQLGDLAGRITELEKKNWESVGKTSVADPALAAALRELNSLKGSSDLGRNQVIAWITAGVMTLIAFVGIVVAILTYATAK